MLLEQPDQRRHDLLPGRRRFKAGPAVGRHIGDAELGIQGCGLAVGRQRGALEHRKAHEAGQPREERLEVAEEVENHPVAFRPRRPALDRLHGLPVDVAMHAVHRACMSAPLRRDYVRNHFAGLQVGDIAAVRPVVFQRARTGILSRVTTLRSERRQNR